MTREEGIKLVLQYDHIKPKASLEYFKMTGMTEEQFDKIADNFRD